MNGAEYNKTKDLFNELQAQEETFWKQRAKCHWLEGGDSNSRFFFHSIASFRKRTNMIVQLRDNLGGWVTTQDGIFALVESYFPHFLWLTRVGFWNSP